MPRGHAVTNITVPHLWMPATASRGRRPIATARAMVGRAVDVGAWTAVECIPERLAREKLATHNHRSVLARTGMRIAVLLRRARRPQRHLATAPTMTARHVARSHRHRRRAE